MSQIPKEGRLKVAVQGAVQGVGFRPFVYRLAAELGLRGYVINSVQGVFIEAEGGQDNLAEFLARLRKDRPTLSRITSLESSWLEPAGLGPFEIRASEGSGPKRTLILPDIATCPDCAVEIRDPANRRHFYPFTNCVHCGPRFSIIEALPYDRDNTSMRRFQMCEACRAEYESPADRRFHAQPNACPVCGPHIELWSASGERLAGAKGMGSEANHAGLKSVAREILAGRIVAMKGLGGFHLLAHAGDASAVETLRSRKRREEKPFAVMFPSLEHLRRYCEVSKAEEALLTGPEIPIVLVRKRSGATPPLAAQIAPGNPFLGAMLPYTPLHLLLMDLLDCPVIATSGNLTDEPICTDEHDALERLRGIADLFLVHNRPIVRHVDDSIVRIVAGREMVLRRARGYAPLPQTLRTAHAAGPVLAMGAHLKSAIALSVANHVFVSQHIGDLETEAAYHAFERAADDLPRLFDAAPTVIATDAHPGYISTRFGEDLSRKAGKLVRVQHHAAHVLSCMADNELEPPLLGVAWDGTGFGPDGTVWGGEFFDVTEQSCKRVGRLRHFRLPGGDAAVKEPRRSAAGLLFEIFGPQFPQIFKKMENGFTAAEKALVARMLAGGINAPLTSSAGRLFDAIASLAGVRQITRHEGQAAMELEFLAWNGRLAQHYPAAITEAGPLAVLDWEPMVRAILEEVAANRAAAEISMAFHSTLIEWIVAMAKRTRREQVVLSGGCFQNTKLLEGTLERLRAAGFKPFWHQRVPPNDGGIALGQIVAATRLPVLHEDGTQSVEKPTQRHSSTARQSGNETEGI